MRTLLALLLFFTIVPASSFAQSLRVGTFAVDASPPVGSPLAYDPTKGVQTPLSCRGFVLLGAEEPIVLCAVDWIGIASGGQDVFRSALAEAAETTPQRVSVHTLHQHDAPRCDFTADAMLQQLGVQNAGFDERWAREVIRSAAAAVKQAVQNAQPVTHLGLGEGVIEKVASNRRILGPDGKVKYTRFTATRDPKIRAFPAGTIDPKLKMISFWNEETPVVAISFYATHPQSYYRTGLASPDFPGLARNATQEEIGIPLIHFNGAGGNIGAGKWNDGSHENRQILADRVAAGMKAAWESTKRKPISASDVAWKSIPVQLPVSEVDSEFTTEEELRKLVKNESKSPPDRYDAARRLVWILRCHENDTIDIHCLTLKDARVLLMPGELFVEYQLAAQKMRPELFVAMAAYGDYAPGYIGTEIAYSQGGYEASPRASRVSPKVEAVLMNAMRTLLKAEK